MMIGSNKLRGTCSNGKPRPVMPYELSRLEKQRLNHWDYDDQFFGQPECQDEDFWDDLPDLEFFDRFGDLTRF